MLQKSDYLRIGKRQAICVKCEKSLTEIDRHPTVLIECDSENSNADQVPVPVDEKTDIKSKEKNNQPTTEEETTAGFQRMDYCEDCWKQYTDNAYFSYWMGKRRDEDLPPIKWNRAARNLALAALFDSLSERKDDGNDYTPHQFFLAHLLMKYKVFRWKPSIEDPETGENMLCFKREGTDEQVLVPNIEMPDELIVKIKNEVEEYLKESTGQEIRL